MTATDDEILIDLDLKTRAFRNENRWSVQKRKSDGRWDMVDTWIGGRRSLLVWCEAHQVFPTRAAERQLADIPETTGFKERT